MGYVSVHSVLHLHFLSVVFVLTEGLKHQENILSFCVVCTNRVSQENCLCHLLRFGNQTAVRVHNPNKNHKNL